MLGLMNVVKSRATCDTSVRSSASSCGSDATSCDVALNMFDGIDNDDTALDSNIGVLNNDIVSSIPSMFIFIDDDGVDELLGVVLCTLDGCGVTNPLHPLEAISRDIAAAEYVLDIMVPIVDVW